MIDGKSRKLSISRQAELLSISRSGLYYCPVPISEEELYIKRIIIEFKEDTNKSFENFKSEIRHVGNQVLKLENDNGQKLDALMDDYKQLAEGQGTNKNTVV